MTKKTNKGTFKKGVSGNPAGRPSKAKQAETIIKKMQDKMPEDFDPTQGVESLEKMLVFFNSMFDSAKSIEDQVGYSKIIVDVSNKIGAYQAAKIANIDSTENDVTELNVSWGPSEAIPDDHPMKDVPE